MVCDLSAGSTSAVPVIDGHVLRKSVVKSEMGGDWLDQKVLEALEEKEIKVVPR